MEVVIVSQNPQKVLLLREILKDMLPNTSILSLFDFPHYTPVQDCLSHSIAERSKEKASHAATALQKCCIAEQWMLYIPTTPFSFLKEDSSSLKIKKVLQALENKPENERSAYLESTITLATPSGKTHQATARCEGVIAEKERGKGGSDFDSIFIKYDYMKTLAELSPTVKSKISHQRKALEKLLIHLEKCCIS